MSFFDLDVITELIARAYYRRDFVELRKEVEKAMARIAPTSSVNVSSMMMKETNMSAYDDLKAAIMTYVAAVDVMIADINARIAAAIAADDAEEDVNLNQLKDDVIAAQGRLPAPPVV